MNQTQKVLLAIKFNFVTISWFVAPRVLVIGDMSYAWITLSLWMTSFFYQCQLTRKLVAQFFESHGLWYTRSIFFPAGYEFWRLEIHFMWCGIKFLEREVDKIDGVWLCTQLILVVRNSTPKVLCQSLENFIQIGVNCRYVYLGTKLSIHKHKKEWA